MAVAPVLADWDPGDPYKMHYPQLPDPTGIDVSFRTPEVLADDWLCSETGPVSDIHFWFSAQNDAQPQIFNVNVSIYSDIPQGPVNPFSMPGNLLWQRDFGPDDFTWRWAGDGQQGWLVPENGTYVPQDHFHYYQMNIEDIVDPFVQTANEMYWLGISVSSETPLGWKSAFTAQQFLGTTTWGNLPNPDWQPVYDPRFPALIVVPLDLAFVITPEPGTIAMFGFLGLAAFRRR